MFEELKDEKIRKLKAYKAIISSFRAVGYDIVDDIELVKFLDDICNLEEFKRDLSSIGVLCSDGVLSELESMNYIIKNDKRADIENALEELSKKEKQFDIKLPGILTEEEIECLKWLSEFDLNKDGHIYNFGNVQIAIFYKYDESKYTNIYQIRVKHVNEENWDLIYYRKKRDHYYGDDIVLERSKIIDKIGIDNIKYLINIDSIFKKYIKSVLNDYEKKILLKKKKNKKKNKNLYD